MAFLSFYLLRGFKYDYLLNLSYDEKLFMIATMDLEIERLNKSGTQYKKLSTFLSFQKGGLNGKDYWCITKFKRPVYNTITEGNQEY